MDKSSINLIGTDKPAKYTVARGKNGSYWIAGYKGKACTPSL